MAINRGSTLRMYVNTGGGTPSYTALDCETDINISFSRAVADTSGKCSDYTTGVKTLSSCSISGSGHYADSDAGVDGIRDAVLSAAGTLVQVKTFGGDMLTGTFNFTQFDYSASYDGVVDFSYSAESNGAFTIETAT